MYKNKKILCFIPARAGSVSIKDKNLQTVGGETLVARSIRHAKQSKYVDRIVLSTDGNRIKEEAISRGSEVINRPDNLSGPKSSTEEAMLHAIEMIECDYIVVLQPTSPFRSEGLVDRCIQRIVDEKSDSLICCLKFHNFCFYKYDKGDMWLSTFDYFRRPMHEDLRESDFHYFDCGCLYISEVESLKKIKCRIGKKFIVEPVSMLESMQIDSKEELEICQDIGGVLNG